MSPLDLLAFPFAQTALIAVALIAVASASVGVFVNLRGLEFVTDGLMHAVFPGLVIGFAIGGQDAIGPAALVAALVTAVLLAWLARRAASSDAAIAVIFTSLFGLGVIVVSRSDQYTAQLERLLFGQLLTVAPSVLPQIAISCALAVAIMALTWRLQVFRAVDPAGAAAAGHPVLALDIALNAAIALVVVAGAQTLGTLMIVGIIIVPAAIARLATTRLGLLAPIAACVSMAAGLLGLWLSFTLSIDRGVSVSSSAMVVLVLVGVYALVLGARGIRVLVERTRAGVRA